MGDRIRKKYGLVEAPQIIKRLTIVNMRYLCRLFLEDLLVYPAMLRVKDFYKKYDLHIHIPEGAIPKDGPSAGITMCTAIISTLTKRPVHRDIAMTGEITLRGRILPIGGLKEKILAAHRGGIKKVLIPKENQKDLKDIPKSISKQIEIVPVEHMDEVLMHALIVNEGEKLFQNSDMAFQMAADVKEERVPLN